MSKDRVVRGCWSLWTEATCKFARWDEDGILRCHFKSVKGRVIGSIKGRSGAPPWCPLPITVRREEAIDD